MFDRCKQAGDANLQNKGRQDVTYFCICAWLGGLSFSYSCTASHGHEDSTLIVSQQRMLPGTLPLDLHTAVD